jgi:initiation factor 1A
MVKNTKGGKGAKNIARKSQNFANKNIRFSEDPLEQYSCVTKMLGNGMCEITLEDNSKIMGHIRNKFRGKQKRHNLITVNSIVLVGLREWENPCKNCDIIFVYDDNHIKQLENKPDIDIKNILQIRTSAQSFGKLQNTDTLFEFDSETNIVEEEIIIDTNEKFEMDTGELVSIDDI